VADTAELLVAISADLPSGYSLRLTHDSPPGTDWIGIEVVLPSSAVFLLAWMMGDDDVQFLHALRTAQGELIEFVLGEAWPRCPAHGSHPLQPGFVGWACPVGSAGPWDYGTLANLPVAPEAYREDGEVRWWLEDLGWGVVAGDEGDVRVHFSAVEPKGYRSLTEGEKVEYRVRTGLYGELRQGAFRQAEWVRRVRGEAGP
jgi:cold shock protein